MILKVKVHMKDLGFGGRMFKIDLRERRVLENGLD
jgi:hypothetical protein